QIWAGHVTGSVNVRLRRLQVFIDLYPARVRFHSDILEAEIINVWPATGTNQERTGGKLVATDCHLDATINPPRCFGVAICHDRHAFVGQALFQELAHREILPWQKMRTALHDGRAHAQTVKRLTELASDRTTTKHNQTFRFRFQLIEDGL